MDHDQNDSTFKTAHNFLRSYLDKDPLYSDEEIQEQKKSELEKRFDYKFILDLDFREYLESVSFEHHRNNDFTATYPVTIEDGLHYLHHKDKKHPFSVLEEYHNSLYQANFNINGIAKPFNEFFNKNYFHLTGVMNSKNNSILILPFFNEIRYYKDFSVFCCTMLPDNHEDVENFIKKLFYFDTKGRCIKEEKGHIPNRIPTVAFNEQDNTFTEISVKFVEKIHSHTLYTVEEGQTFSVVNHQNEFLIDGFYEKLFVNDSLDYVFTQHENDILLHSLTHKTKVKLAEGQLVDQKNTFIRFFDIDKKWGLLKNETFETRPEYDYLDWTYDATKLKAFTGDFSWTHSDEFYDHVSPKITDLNEDYYTSYGKKSGKGQWGIVNVKSEIIIPFEYEWIEELTPNLYLANKNGEVYRFDLDHEYSQWKKPEVYHDEHVVMGGEWYILDLLGNVVQKLTLKELNELYSSGYIKNEQEFIENIGTTAYKF